MFSHYLCHQDGTTSQSFTPDQMTDLVRMVLEGGVTPFTTTDPNINLNALTSCDVVNGSGRVLLVFDQFTPSPEQYAAGAFAYSDFSSSGGGVTGNLTVFDCYANTDSLSYMRADQLGG